MFSYLSNNNTEFKAIFSILRHFPQSGLSAMCSFHSNSASVNKAPIPFINVIVKIMKNTLEQMVEAHTSLRSFNVLYKHYRHLIELLGVKEVGGHGTILVKALVEHRKRIIWCKKPVPTLSVSITCIECDHLMTSVYFCGNVGCQSVLGSQREDTYAELEGQVSGNLCNLDTLHVLPNNVSLNCSLHKSKNFYQSILFFLCKLGEVHTVSHAMKRYRWLKSLRACSYK